MDNSVMAAFGPISKEHVLRAASELGLQLLDSRLGFLKNQFELAGELSGQPVHATIPALPQQSLAVEIRMPFEPSLDLGLRVERDHVDPYKELRVSADEVSRAEALLGDELRHALGPGRYGAVLKDDGLCVSATDPYNELFGEGAFGTLLEMFRWAEELHGRTRLARRSVPVATCLRPYEEAWTLFAERGLELAACPLRLFGSLDGARVSAMATRQKPSQYHFELRADFDAPLPFSFTIRPTRGRDRVAAWFGAGDVQVGDEAFDAAFELRFDDDADIQRLLRNDAVRALVALSQAGAVSVDGTGASVIVPGEREPDEVLRCFERVGQLTRVLFANAFGLATPGETYR